MTVEKNGRKIVLGSSSERSMELSTKRDFFISMKWSPSRVVLKLSIHSIGLLLQTSIQYLLFGGLSGSRVCGLLPAYQSRILCTQISTPPFSDSEHTNMPEPLHCLRHTNKQLLRDLFIATSKIWSSSLLPLKHQLGAVTFLLQTAFHWPLY